MCQGDGFQLRQGSSGGDPGSLGSLERAHGVLATPGEPRDGKVLGRQGLQSPHLQTRRESRKASQRAEVVGGIYAGKSGGLSGETQDFTDSLFIVLRGARRDALNDPSGVNRHHRADEGLWWTQFVLHKLARCTRDHGTNFGCLRTTSTLPTIQRLTLLSVAVPRRSWERDCNGNLAAQVFLFPRSSCLSPQFTHGRMSRQNILTLWVASMW